MTSCSAAAVADFIDKRAGEAGAAVVENFVVSEKNEFILELE